MLSQSDSGLGISKQVFNKAHTSIINTFNSIHVRFYVILSDFRLEHFQATLQKGTPQSQILCPSFPLLNSIHYISPPKVTFRLGISKQVFKKVGLHPPLGLPPSQILFPS